MPPFIPGLELSEIFYSEAVRPILESDVPDLRYSAALIGSGSEVLGFDTPRSTDHHWGPRLLLFLEEEEFEARSAHISAILSDKLPYSVRGFSTNFGPPDAIGVRLMQPISTGSVRHMVQIYTIRSFFEMYLGLDPGGEITPADWLTFSEHRLLGSTSGNVFHDGLGQLMMIRQKLAYYPRDIWLYLLAAQWQKIAQEEAFVGRCGEVEDELGSRMIATRIVRWLMQLCFLMERRYAPYHKWFGTAFARLTCAPQLLPRLEQVLAAGTWRERELHLAEAYRLVAEQHNSLGIMPPLPTTVSNYYDRPYRVIHAGSFADAIRQSIASDQIKQMRPLIGSINQWVDSTDVTENIELCRKLKRAYV